MSYCRFSCDGSRSDVYVYESCYDTWVVHIAGHKISNIDEAPEGGHLKDDSSIYAEKHRARMKWMGESAKRVPIGLSRDGESHDFATAEEAADFLAELKAEGYHVPDHVIPALREEHQESEL